MRVLLIEDAPRLAEAVAEILRKSGYGADIAHIGADGLAMALAGAYDVLLLDIMVRIETFARASLRFLSACSGIL